MTRVALVAVVALLVCGCGRAAKPVADPADLAPPTTPTFVVLKTDLGSLPQVLLRFPFGPSTLRAIRDELRPRRALGPELGLAVFKGGTVYFTQPRDEKRFEASLAPREVHAQLRGWTAYTDKPALLDLVRHHDGALSARRGYVLATKELPPEAVARAYTTTGTLPVRGIPSMLLPPVPARPKWLGAAVSARDDELAIEARTPRPSGAAEPPSTELVSRIPAGAVLAATPDAIPDTLAVAGLNLRQVAGAAGEHAVAYVRPGLPFPEVTIVSRPNDPRAALRDVARLVTRLARPRFDAVTITVDGVKLADVALGAVDLYYGTHDGLVVLSDTTDAVAALGSSGDKLNVPGLPERADRLVFLDAEHGLPALRAFAQLANQRVPAELETNLGPLRTLLSYRTRDAGTLMSVAVLRTR